MGQNTLKFSPADVYEARSFEDHLDSIIHDWSKTLLLLTATIIPVFFILDYFTMPVRLLPRFAIYRLLVALIALFQYLILLRTRPGRMSAVHGYLVTLVAGSMIARMTADLGGFDSRYYAGLILVITGVNLLLPWRPIHSAINGTIILWLYLLFNLGGLRHFEPKILANNLFFLAGAVVISVAVTNLRHRQIKREFDLVTESRKIREALFAEMELAKRIQLGLLPRQADLKGYEAAAIMFPAAEVGGDYYDTVTTVNNETWLAIGDVSGHGLDSGLIMMMAQTAFLSAVNGGPDRPPSEVLQSVNRVLRDNIDRLGRDNYMTMSAVRLMEDSLIVAGRHQDILIHRGKSGLVEQIPTQGTWLGLADNVEPYMTDTTVPINPGDTLVFFSDGLTEAADEQGRLFGQENLVDVLADNAGLSPARLADKLLERVSVHQGEQLDDMTVVVARKTAPAKSKME